MPTDKKSDSESDSDDDQKVRISVKKADSSGSEGNDVENIIENISPAYRYQEEVVEREK